MFDLFGEFFSPLGEADSPAFQPRLFYDYRHVRRLLNLDHPTRLDHLESALSALGKRLELIIRDAA